jgi:hypothetical protein
MFFGFLLLSLFGISIMYPFVYKGEHLGTTQRCIPTEFARYGSIPALITAIFDTFIFLAISLHIASNTLLDNDTFSTHMKSFLRGQGLPNISKCILQGGQLYYLFMSDSCHYNHILIFPLQCNNLFKRCGGHNGSCTCIYVLSHDVCPGPYCTQ